MLLNEGGTAKASYSKTLVSHFVGDGFSINYHWFDQVIDVLAHVYKVCVDWFKMVYLSLTLY